MIWVKILHQITNLKQIITFELITSAKVTYKTKFHINGKVRCKIVNTITNLTYTKT